MWSLSRTQSNVCSSSQIRSYFSCFFRYFLKLTITVCEYASVFAILNNYY
ncbi:unnamed protein product [Hymenolepis diminuta]|uniref:Uncharacterized protein n=1 Tax=Hymenolepis diminuta TaxID=6216 RepID=A0A3P6W932_HYMDI|nr:unnamed protein product [Hymenolepis diminuta]